MWYENLFDLKHLSVTNMQKTKASGGVQIVFHSTVKKRKHSTDVLNLHYKWFDEGFFLITV